MAVSDKIEIILIKMVSESSRESITNAQLTKCQMYQLIHRIEEEESSVFLIKG